MQKEEKVVVVLLLMALGSLFAASWALGDFGGPAEPDQASISIVAEGQVGSITTTTGGHLIIRLQHSAMPIFVKSENGALDVAMRVAKGDQIRVRGEVTEYEGRREISVQRAEDVAVL